MPRNKYTTEERIDALEKKLLTLYNRFYASNIRADRRNLYRRQTELMKRWVEKMDGLPMRKLAWLATRLENGRHIMTLDNRERSLLTAILKGHVKVQKKNGVVLP